MPQLTHNQRAIAMTLIGEGMAEKEVADKFWVSRSCITRLKKGAKTRRMKPGQVASPRPCQGVCRWSSTLAAT
jgi:transposase